MSRSLVVSLATAFGLTVAMIAQSSVDPDAGRNWASPQGDLGGTRYSTLTQINTTNVRQLKRAWTFRTGSGRFANAPMVVDSVMYFSAPNGVYAVDAVTGQQLWKYAPGRADAQPMTAAPTITAARPGDEGGADDLPAQAGRGAAPAGGGGGGGGRGGAPNTAGTAVRGPSYWPC